MAASNSFRNLPPEVRRELLRHVKPAASISRATGRGSTAAAAAAALKERRDRSARNWLIGCTAFVGAAASLPYWATRTVGNLTEREDALNASSVRRGPYLNSGSRDAGRDPNWKNGVYVYPKGFAEHLKKQDPGETNLGPDIGPMVAAERKNKKVAPS